MKNSNRCDKILVRDWQRCGGGAGRGRKWEYYGNENTHGNRHGSETLGAGGSGIENTAFPLVFTIEIVTGIFCFLVAEHRIGPFDVT